MSRFNVKELARRLNEVRDNGQQVTFEPPPCTCEPISNGCHCGRFEWEMAQKANHKTNVRYIAHDPQVGDAYIISRPPGTEIDYYEVPFRVWAKCDGKWAEVLEIEEDSTTEGLWWCWCDVSNITKQPGDEFWFPNDGLLRRRS